ncbi:hypothetical protein JJV70_20750 [Streptomyces sp. JJ66]|uniref:tRNA adenosine deaminase-associated protein n=1 Tax=Streptomyces sp. JJ66 TaxID=2803843 RepID=UPI001C583C1E|nr:hypothetical protein [Streptomyces sp. JJ66]MBW1604487.1 hypothetical protein [Streptomyces sp. JJ66]
MYFAALLARTEEGWEASDTELDDVETLDDLADLARAAAVGEDTVLVCIEQEGDWFGVVRVDGEEDPRIYVSSGAAAARSAYGEILLTDELLGREPDDGNDLERLTDLDGTEDGEPEPDEDQPDDGPHAAPEGPVGDAELLEDFGMKEKELLSLPADGALSDIAATLGCTELLESVR